MIRQRLAHRAGAAGRLHGAWSPEARTPPPTPRSTSRRLLTASAFVLERDGHAISIPTTQRLDPGDRQRHTASARSSNRPSGFFGAGRVRRSGRHAQVRLSVNPGSSTPRRQLVNGCTCNLSNLLGLPRGCLTCSASECTSTGVSLAQRGIPDRRHRRPAPPARWRPSTAAARSHHAGPTPLPQAVTLNTAASLNLNVTLAGNSLAQRAAGATSPPARRRSPVSYRLDVPLTRASSARATPSRSVQRPGPERAPQHDRERQRLDPQRVSLVTAPTSGSSRACRFRCSTRC